MTYGKPNLSIIKMFSRDILLSTSHLLSRLERLSSWLEFLKLAWVSQVGLRLSIRNSIFQAHFSFSLSSRFQSFKPSSISSVNFSLSPFLYPIPILAPPCLCWPRLATTYIRIHDPINPPKCPFNDHGFRLGGWERFFDELASFLRDINRQAGTENESYCEYTFRFLDRIISLKEAHTMLSHLEINVLAWLFTEETSWLYPSIGDNTPTHKFMVPICNIKS